MMLYWNIRVGMTQEEVQAQIKSFYPPKGENKPPISFLIGGEKMEIQMAADSTDTLGHESIILKMQNGQVLGANYQARE